MASECDHKKADYNSSHNFPNIIYADYFFRSLAAPLISVLPIFLSSPCFVVGIPVVRAIVLLSTSTPNARLGENDVPGMLKIFMMVVFFVYI